MICKVCGYKVAPYPEEDFIFEDGKGFFPRHKEAEKKRQEVFESDKPTVCAYCLEEQNEGRL